MQGLEQQPMCLGILAVVCTSSIYLPQAHRLKVSFFTRMSFFNTIGGFSGTTPVK